MRKRIASTAVAAGLALGVAMGSSAKADPPTQALESSTADLTSSAKPLPAPPVGKPAPQAKPQGQGQPTPQAAPTQQGMPPQGVQGPGMSAVEAAQAQTEAQAKALQAQIADATARLEAAFEQQFKQAEISREKLQHLIDQAVQAFPAQARGQVQLHIDKVIATGEQVAPQMTQEERDSAVTPPEQLGQTEQGLITGWGWGAPFGFGGLGAFGFPGAFGAGWGGLGGFGFPGVGLGGLGAFGNPFLFSYPAAGFGACGAGLCGAGLGAGGWFW